MGLKYVYWAGISLSAIISCAGIMVADMKIQEKLGLVALVVFSWGILFTVPGWNLGPDN